MWALRSFEGLGPEMLYSFAFLNVQPLFLPLFLFI